MNELLSKIDKDLIDLEERLLLEVGRLRKLESTDTYSEINADLKAELKVIYSALVETLEGTAKTGQLSIKSNEQLWIEDRFRVVRNLLVSKLPTAFLKLSHTEHRMHKREPHESERHVASRELAILSEQVLLHVRDGQSIADIVKDRAQFTSRELSKGHASEFVKPERTIAQSPDEIRRKLEGRQSTQGPSMFASKDLSSKPAFQEAPARGPIAQTPEEIRRKLAERQAQAAGKATFGAKDIESLSDKFPAPGKEEKKPAGKAIFEARDLSDPKK